MRIITVVKIILLSIALFFVGISGYSQGFGGKVIVGLNASQIDGDGLSGFYQPGLYGGLAASFPIRERMAIEPQFCYSVKGSRTSDDQILAGADAIVFRLNYVELPIMLNYRLRSDLLFQGGLAANYLVSAQSNEQNTGFQDITNAVKRFDYTVAASLEYLVWQRFGLNIRYSYSLVPMNNGSFNVNLPTTIIPNAFNNSLTFSVRYYLNSPSELVITPDDTPKEPVLKEF